MNFSFDNYTLSIFLVHIIFASMTFFLGLRFLQLLFTKDQKIDRNILFLTFCSLALTLILAVGIIDVVATKYSNESLVFGWMFGLSTYYFYMRSMRVFLEFKNRTYLVLEKIYLSALCFYIADAVYYVFTQKTFLNEPLAGDLGLYYQKMNYLLTPNILGNTLSAICGLSFLVNCIFLLNKTIRSQNRDYLLILGVSLSITALINDSLVGSGVLYYGVPLSFLSCIFELTRFSNHFVSRDHERISKLSLDLTKNAKAAHLGMISGSIAHDINNFLTKINLSLTLLKKKIDRDSSIDNGILGSINTVLESTHKIHMITKTYTSFLHTTEKVRSDLPAIHISDLVKEAVADIENLLSERRISVNLDVDTAVPPFSWKLLT